MTPSPRLLLIAAALPFLAGCVNDSASYMIDGDRKHAITVKRAQSWFWNDALDVTVVAARDDECVGGLDLGSLKRDDELVLHQAPDEYEEPIYILSVDGDSYAISTRSCRVQRFEAPPAEPGPEVGRFQETDGKLQFLPAGG